MVLNIHPALIGAGESGKTLYKSTLDFGTLRHLGKKQIKPKSCCQSRDGEKCSAALGLPWRGIYFGTNKEGGTGRLPCVCCVCTSILGAPLHNPNYAGPNMKSVIGMQMVDPNGTGNVNRIIQAKIQRQEHRTKQKCTHIREIITKSSCRVTGCSIMLPSLPFRSVCLHKFGFN